MGCSSSSSADLQQRILPLPIDIINAYIDRVSIVMINKIKDKLLTSFNQKTYEIDQDQFISLFRNTNLPQVRIKSLFAYFNNNTKNGVRINKFIEKYCILVKSDAVHFSQIIHRIYCKVIELDKMGLQEFHNFQDQCSKYIKQGIQIGNQKFPLPWSQFFQHTKNIVNWQEFQNSFHIVSIDELPYKSFHEELEKFNMEFLETGESYFVVSAEWISQWIFFYEYQDTDIKNSSYRSNKSSQIIRKKSLTVKRKVSKNRLNSSKLFSNENPQNVLSLLPPTQISMNEIQGEYYGQLKPFLNVERDIAVINKKMWTILKDTLGSTVQFQRQAIDEYSLELYPVFVYFYQLDKDGNLSTEQFQILKAKRSIFQNRFEMLSKKSKYQKQKTDTVLYYKNFESLTFEEWKSDQTLQDCVNEKPRIIIIQVPLNNQENFIKKYQRSQIKIQNIMIGDKVLAYFSYQDKFVESYILHVRQDKKQFKVHFIGFSHHYERQVKSKDIKLLQNKDEQQEKKQVVYEKQVLFWGIPNVGNTCFINSILQSLISTTIFDQFFLKANLSSKKSPLSYDFSNVVKGLINRQKFNIVDFKKAINHTMPIFSGFDQHDAQQFLNLFLDKLDSQLNQKPNIIDQLFGGIMQSKFTCLKCRQVKTKEQKIHSISLPIPQSENNYFVIIIFPIYSSNVRKIILRFHKNAKVIDFLTEIQRRSNIRRQDLLYIESQYSVLKRFRSDLVLQINEDKKLTEMGLNSNVQIWAFEKLRDTTIEYQLQKNKLDKQTTKEKINVGQFYDFYSNQEACWGIARIKYLNQEKIGFQFLKDNNIKPIQLKRQQKIDDLFIQLGTKFMDKLFRRIFMRKWSQNSSKMVYFANQFFIGIPRWSSYKDTLIFFDEYLHKMRKKTKRSSRVSSMASSYGNLGSGQALQVDHLKLSGLNTTFMEDKNQPYVIHFLQTQKNSCIFCHKELQVFHSSEQIKRCCQPQQKEIPLFWASEERSIYFIVDWVQMQEYNEGYLNNIEMDKMSISAQEKMKQQRISLQDCIELWKKPQNIEMQCEKCKYDEHLLETSIKKAPIITVFHLKQFRYTQEGHFIKLNINLNWIDSINLQSYCSNPTQNQKGSVYEMYSVITHRGNTTSGHYTCMAKRKHPLQKTKVWVNFDDDKTEILTKKPQVIDNAYLLFFKKVDIPSSAVVHFSI